MRRIFVLIVFGLLLFGCINLGGEEPAPATPYEPAEETGGVDETPAETGTVVEIGETQETSVVQEPSGETAETQLPQGETKGYIYEPNADMYIYFINVGTSEIQGDAILVEKGDFHMLVDAGPEESSSQLVKFLSSRVDDIDVLVSTHDDPEHYGGMSAVLDNYAVEEFWYSGNTFTEDYKDLISKIENKNIPVKIIDSTDSFDLNGINIQIFNPPAEGSFESADVDAVAMKLTDRAFSILLTSDIMPGSQQKMLNEFPDEIKCKVFQVPWHGLGRGNTQISLVLSKVNPESAVMSGSSADPENNRYTVTEQLNIKKIPTYNNFEGTALRVGTDGVVYSIDTVYN
ncbi:MBL fold metallo-hydrolase [Candidatus Micrarchaeota archaeon]|nr:MBL fold metallo-hydrolase [Candidatus Micrarchaeota archaeon]